MSITKWHEQAEVDDSVIISSRIRLARNLTAFPFPSRISSAGAASAIETIRGAAFGKTDASDATDATDAIGYALTFCDLSQLPTEQLRELCEKRVISFAMVNKAIVRGLIYNDEENISILLNEEDHLRIQAIAPGHDLDAAYEIAVSLDDTISQGLEYAFDAEFGYLTSCPTNTGTGLRASYMLHLPLLENTGSIKAYADVITKAGFAIRGTHGEGTEPMGAIYQISNQITLGKTEAETLSALKHLANQIVDKELALRERVIKEFLHETEDAVFRAYGILTNCRKIGLDEAMRLLSEIRLGNILGLLKHKPLDSTIYNLMINILPYTLQRTMGKVATDTRMLDVLRADYLRKSIQ